MEAVCSKGSKKNAAKLIKSSETTELLLRFEEFFGLEV